METPNANPNNNTNSNEIKKTPNWSLRIEIIILIYWFIITGALTWYIIPKWDVIISFTFFTEFNGNNLLFLIWLILLAIPLVGKFEGFGVKLDFLNKENIINNLSAEAERARIEIAQQAQNRDEVSSQTCIEEVDV